MHRFNQDVSDSQEKREEDTTKKYLSNLRSLKRSAEIAQSTNLATLLKTLESYINEYRKTDTDADIVIDDSGNNFFNLCHILVYFPCDIQVVECARKLTKINPAGFIKALTKIRSGSENRTTPIELALMKGRVDYAVFIIEFLFENKKFDESYLGITFKLYHRMKTILNSYPLDFEKFIEFYNKISKYLLKNLSKQSNDFSKSFFSHFHEAFKENNSKISDETKYIFNKTLTAEPALLKLFKEHSLFKELSKLINFSENIYSKENINMQSPNDKKRKETEGSPGHERKKEKTNTTNSNPAEKEVVVLVDYILSQGKIDISKFPKEVKEIIEPRISTPIQKNKKKLPNSQFVKASTDIAPPDLEKFKPKNHRGSNAKEKRSDEDKIRDVKVGRQAEKEVYKTLIAHYKTRYTLSKEESTKYGVVIEGKNKAKLYNASIEVTWFNKDQPDDLDASHTYGYDFFVKKTKGNSVSQQIINKAIEVKGTAESGPAEARFTNKELKNLAKMGDRYKVYRVYDINEEASPRVVPITGLDKQLSFTEEALENITHLNYKI